jgi:hypothetical protein
MAFDNHRRGFIIGGLGGIAVNTWNEFDGDDTGVLIAEGSNIALHIDFRIGGGFKGDKFMFYFWEAMNWHTPISIAGDSYYTYLTISGVTGIGASYYFKPTSPSVYINAGIGMSMRNIIATWVIGGIGYEFTRHWSVECDVMWGNGTQFINLNYVHFLPISLSIIGIAY